METRANYVLVGAFTLAVVAAAFGFVYWFSNLGDHGVRETYRVVFDGTVSGLRTGSSVLFNGIRAGETTELKLNPTNPRQVVATIAVEPKTPIRSDTSVSLDFQGLTGIASISLKGGTPGAATLPIAQDGGPPLLVADASATQDVTQSAREVLRKVDNFFAESEGPLHDAIRNLDTFSATLAKNSERIDHVIAGVEGLFGADGKGEINEAVHSLKALADNLDKRTADITAGVTRFTGSGLREWEALAVDGRRTLSDLDRAIKNLDRNPQRVIFGGSGTSGAVPEYSGRR
jgi:phospholipid/cholesterol/gamma-HCH transport system substrate-binding protein